MDRTHSSINSLLEQATCIAKRSKEAAGETESTEGYKRRQTEELIKFANDNSLWIDLSRLNITYMDRGGENEVFHDGNVSVVKLNNFEYAADKIFIIIFTFFCDCEICQCIPFNSRSLKIIIHFSTVYAILSH